MALGCDKEILSGPGYDGVSSAASSCEGESLTTLGCDDGSLAADLD